MQPTPLLPTLAGALCLLAPFATGHGGQYRGPGDTVPPGGSGGGGGGAPGTGPAGPGSPVGNPGGIGRPGTGGPGRGPGAGPGGALSPGGEPPADLTAWSFWWEFNKDPYLDLKRKLHEGGPSTGDGAFYLGAGTKRQSNEILRPDPRTVREVVVPALLRALEDDPAVDIETAAMIALAKIGENQGEGGESSVRPRLRARLASKNQEVSETAALALGIRGHLDSIDLLAPLLQDADAGRALVGRGEVPFRTRAFAAYALGLVGSRNAESEEARRIVRILSTALDSDDSSSRDLQVACILALGLVPLTDEGPVPGDAIPDPATGRTGQIGYLLRVYADEELSEFTRAHCPLSLARLALGAGEAHEARVTDSLLAAFARGAKPANSILQSSAQVLGLLGDRDDDERDERIREVLTAAIQGDVADQQTRRFAMIALAKVGARPGEGPEDAGPAVRDTLLRALSRGQQTARSWAGLALGVHGAALADAQEVPPAELLQAVRETLAGEKQVERIGALSIAAGILRDIEATAILRAHLAETEADEARGYVALGLGLLGELSAKDDIRALLADSTYRPELLSQAAIALGLLGDKSIVDELSERLAEADTLAVQAALASALGKIGDKRSIEPLIGLLEDEGATPLARGFAAAALGIVADKEFLPWNSKLAVDLNYRAATETLTGTGEASTGVLDIL